MTRFLIAVTTLAAVGCGGATSEPAAVATEAGTTAAETSVEATPVVFNEAGAPIVEIEAPGMHCGACAANICKALREQPGVVDVKADADTKLVVVAIDEAAFESNGAIAAIADAGFGEATLVDDAEAGDLEAGNIEAGDASEAESAG